MTTRSFFPRYRLLLLVGIIALLPQVSFAAMNRLAWANHLLARLGAPQNVTNQRVLVAWMQAEGNGCQWNPLNTTQTEPGSTVCGNTHGIQNFPTCDLGLFATSDVLRQTEPGTVFDNSAILTSLVAGNNGQATISAITSSGWGTGSLLQQCYDDVIQNGAFDQYASVVVGPSDASCGAPPPPASPATVGIAGRGTDGYWTVNSKGGVSSHGSAVDYGSIRFALNKPIVGMAATPSGHGYWLVAADGGVFGFGDAIFHGSMGGQTLNKPVVGMAAAPVTSAHPHGGYWLVASDGGIFGFDADFHGSMGGQHLNKPVVGMATAPITTTHPKGGYWLVASDGGIFGFDADFKGSMGGTTLNAPVTGMAASGNGYWLVARDGGIFGFNVPYKGSLGSNPPPSGVVGMARTSTGKGYWLLAGNGAVTGFGDAAAGCN